MKDFTTENVNAEAAETAGEINTQEIDFFNDIFIIFLVLAILTLVG